MTMAEDCWHGLPLANIPQRNLVDKVKKAVKMIARTLSLYPLGSIAFSFNGGKDSTVLLHLLMAAIAEHLGKEGGVDKAEGLHGVRSFYFLRNDDFEEVESFVKHTDESFNMKTDYILDPDFKNGLAKYISDNSTQAILLGTRRGDPNATDQDFYCPSSAGWPPFMRINPILDWSYTDVWTFLRACSLPYCKLYDEGYTSLGSKYNTIPNSNLRRSDGTYAPAYRLSDGRLERMGRGSAVASPRKGKSGGVVIEEDLESVEAGLTRSAAIVIIGDELLSGKVGDGNVSYLCTELHSMGWRVVKVAMLPDSIDAIAQEIRALCDTVELVITSGGVGPTLDDVTMEGVSKALNRKVIRNPDFEARLRHYFTEGLTPAHLKMAETPDAETELIEYTLPDGRTSAFPIVRCHGNIYVLPGVPHLLRQKWQAIKRILLEDSQLLPFKNKVFRLSTADEAKISTLLGDVQATFTRDVQIASYPMTDEEDGAKLLISLEGKQGSKLELAASMVRTILADHNLLSEDVDVKVLSRSTSRAEL